VNRLANVTTTQDIEGLTEVYLLNLMASFATALVTQPSFFNSSRSHLFISVNVQRSLSINRLSQQSQKYFNAMFHSRDIGGVHAHASSKRAQPTAQCQLIITSRRKVAEHVSKEGRARVVSP
jgi:hypothetical protein